MSKITFDDLVDISSLEKTLEFDIIKLIEKYDQERNRSAFELYEMQQNEIKTREIILSIVKEVVRQEITSMIKGKSLFNEQVYKELESAGFERDCYGCYMAEKRYGRLRN